MVAQGETWEGKCPGNNSFPGWSRQERHDSSYQAVERDDLYGDVVKEKHLSS